MDKAEKGTTPRNLLRLCFWKAVPKKMICFLRVFCTLPQLQHFSLVLSTSSTWFLHEKAPEGFPKGSEGVSSCTFETDGHSFRKDCSSFEKYYIYMRFLKRIAHFQKNAELHVMLHLLKSCAFLWICTWQRHVYIYIYIYIHSKRMVAL